MNASKPEQSLAQIDESASQTAEPARVHPHVHPYRYVVILSYLILCLSQTTISSLGADFVRDGDKAECCTIGRPQTVRSDEILRQTPLILGYMATDGKPVDSELAVDSSFVNLLPTSGLIDHLVLWDSTILLIAPFLPDGMLFAAYWWLPTLLFLLGMPYLLRKAGVSQPLAGLATGLIYLSPSALWWSLFSVRVMGFVVAGGALLIYAVSLADRGRKYGALGIAVLAAVMWARMPMSYVPWALVLGPPLAAIAIYAAFRASRRARTAALVTTATIISAVGLFLVILIEHWQTITVGLNTVYPGDRKSGAQFTSWLQLFGSPLLYGDQFTQQFKLNQSEVSSSFLICGVVAIALLLFKGRVKVLGKLVIPIAILGVTVVLWTLWSSVNLTALTRNLPIINRVPAVRAAQVVGILAILLLVFTLQAVSPQLRPVHRLAAATLSVISVLGAALSANLFPKESLSIIAVAVPAAICGLLTVVITVKNLRYVQVAVCLALASILVARINPIQIGLADLRDGAAAGQVRDLSGINAGRHEVWASDSFQIDALLMSNGIATLSGQQSVGPNRTMWDKLYPSHKYEKIWNNGASYVVFGWSDTATPITVDNLLSPDVIRVNVDPCNILATGISLDVIIASRPLAETCLDRIAVIAWAGGSSQYVYRILKE